MPLTLVYLFYTGLNIEIYTNIAHLFRDFGPHHLIIRRLVDNVLMDVTLLVSLHMLGKSLPP